MNRKAKAKQRVKRERQAVAEARRRRVQTAAARAAHSALNHPDIRTHDALVLPEIERMRGQGVSWKGIAEWLNGRIDPPGRRGLYSSGKWHAGSVIRIARRHGVPIGRRGRRKRRNACEDGSPSPAK